ncbi:MAG: hypothetical protein IJL72_05900 [Lachnospiraceae bacterium]|nr:hypothetical protein [Lachnospiraceae bacterium]
MLPFGKIRKIVGTGGIGRGIFFHFHEMADLGRNESRMATLTDAKDYCKLHIVFHYLTCLLSPEVTVLPVGMVGSDAEGAALTAFMQEAGMDISHIGTDPARPTMLSVCFQYPDRSGGNITTDNSACAAVSEDYIREELSRAKVGPDTLAAALPEVPLASRLAMLRAGRESGAVCCCSVAASEAADYIRNGGPEITDLLALNGEEAAAVSGLLQVTEEKEARKAAETILEKWPHLLLWITYGSGGSLLADRDGMNAFGILPDASPVNTGGAGDASLAGLIAGLILFDGDREKAGRCAVLCAGRSVESPDSIDTTMSWDTIRSRGKLAGPDWEV